MLKLVKKKIKVRSEILNLFEIEQFANNYMNLLRLRNFTSYKDETIHFDQYGSPLLVTGDNGNGKSSIIDAITTALFFRARGTDSREIGRAHV